MHQIINNYKMTIDFKIDTAIILAGGLGTRLREVVSDVPKPMALIMGRPFLEYLLDAWISKGIVNFVISVGYKCEVIISHFGSKYRDANISYVVETIPLGTGGGLLRAIKYLKNREDYLILNGDSYFDIPLEDLCNFYNKNNAKLCFSLFKTNETKRYMGIDISPKGKVNKVNINNNGYDNLVNGGVYIIKNNLLERFILDKEVKLSLENDIIPDLINNHEAVFGLEFNNPFIDIGIPKDYARASKILTPTF